MEWMERIQAESKARVNAIEGLISKPNMYICMY